MATLISKFLSDTDLTRAFDPGSFAFRLQIIFLKLSILLPDEIAWLGDPVDPLGRQSARQVGGGQVARGTGYGTSAPPPIRIRGIQYMNRAPSPKKAYNILSILDNSEKKKS